MKRLMIKALLRYLPCIIVTIVLTAGYGHAAQQFQGLCSYVKIEILQEMTLERTGFLATLTVTNNEGDASITNFNSALTFEKEIEGGVMEDASDLFFVQPPKISGVTSIDGTGIISPGQTAMVEWFIIPKLATGGTTPDGLRYEVGASLSGSIYGLEISQDVFRVFADTITVKPDPELEITYFQPRDVDGDNPFTPDIVESPVPFTLGVLVKNVGYGAARKIKIESEQPRIIENEQGLLVVPQLLGARVDDQPTDNTSLTVDLGDIQPGKCRKGAWDMITTLSGEFTEFNASYTHSPELGGEETSLIREINAYFIVHEVLNDQPGRDNLLDFLAETLDGEALIPDTLFESDCNTLPVNHVTDVEVTEFSGHTAIIRATTDIENWVFMRLVDPGQARYTIDSVVRSDGKVLNSNNYWTNIRYSRTDNAKLTYLNIFDFVGIGEYHYTVTYQPSGLDTEPPVTTLHLSGPSQLRDGKYYVLPETQIFFITDDESPTGSFYKLNDAPDFAPAYPFTISDAGEHNIEYYSRDIEGNEEIPQIATIVVSVDDPEIRNLSGDTNELFIAGDSISVRPTSVTVGFNGIMTASRLDAVVEVYRGIFAYPTVSGVPSSPTKNNSVNLTIGGENVDFYRYRIGSGAWSSEFSVSELIQLSSLSGTVVVSVSGRNQNGEYHSDDEAVTVTWSVDPGASDIAITHSQSTPTKSSQVSMNISGSDDYCYRVDGKYYQPDAGAASVDLSRLANGEHTVEVLGRATDVEPCTGDVPGTIVRWTVDRDYGLRFPSETRVRYEEIGQIDANPTEYTWDGLTDSGSVATPGWYSIKITVTDGLGRSTSVVKLIYVGDMIAGGALLSNAGNARQKEVHGVGRWVVWQDQRNGSWDIFALDLGEDSAIPSQITSTDLNQERPRTDGQYAVWEDRQPDGNWDVWGKNLGSSDLAFAVTATTGFNESKPVIYWPWVVYQSKPVADPTAPWQLMVHNMLTGITTPIDVTTQDQLDPSIHKQRVVWQDFRDVGYGEIYMKDLKNGVVRRITNDPGGQYYPVIFDQWIAWADNRNTQFDLYGFNLNRGVEVQLTSTPEDESRPYLNGEWVVYQEDSAGESDINLRVLYLANLASIQLTNESSEKEKPNIASGKLFWVDLRNGYRQVMAGPVPDLQPVFNNRNTVAVTQGMVDNMVDAYSLLELWNAQAGVLEITRYTSLLPHPIEDTVTWSGNAPMGNNYTLKTGDFLWVRFNQTHILDLGNNECTPVNLAAGTNVFSYTCYPDQYTAYQLIRELGVSNVNAIRVLDSKTGRWQAASVHDGLIVGENFKIPSVAVIMLDLNTALGEWLPGETP